MVEAVPESGVPVTGGSLVVSVRDARWLQNRMRLRVSLLVATVL
jgi:hypothetical protein